MRFLAEVEVVEKLEEGLHGVALESMIFSIKVALREPQGDSF
jgi:hypothetical protein